MKMNLIRRFLFFLLLMYVYFNGTSNKENELFCIDPKKCALGHYHSEVGLFIFSREIIILISLVRSFVRQKYDNSRCAMR